MSKYHKIDSEHSTYETDDYTSLYFDNNRDNYNYNNNNNNNNNSNNNNERLNLIVVGSENDTHLNAHDAFEEHTMEVPLLRHNSDSNLHDCEPHQQTPLYSNGNAYCYTAQLGFGVKLKCKSTQEAKFKILLAISLCCIFMIIEFLGGYIAGSLAIMTDAAHLASDCISFVIGLVAIWLGGRPPDKRMSFGYKRVEVFGAIASIFGIWILTATLVMVAIQRIFLNDFDLNANTMMTISGIGILINIAMVFILHGSWFTSTLGIGGHGHSHAHAHSPAAAHTHADTDTTTTMPTITADALMPNGNGAAVVIENDYKEQQPHQRDQHNVSQNLNLRAALIHVIGDLVQSIGVFLAAVLIKFCPSAKFADPLCTLLFSVIVIMTTVSLFKESVNILLDAVPRGISLQELEIELGHIEGVKSVHHLNVWSHTANHNVLMVHLVIDLLTDSNTVLDKATRLAESGKYKIKHSTIQIERLSA